MGTNWSIYTKTQVTQVFIVINTSIWILYRTGANTLTLLQLINIYEINYPPITKEMKTDLKRWTLFPLDRQLYFSVKENLRSDINTALNIWFDECHRLNRLDNIKQLKWVANDSDFKPAMIYIQFNNWLHKGITALFNIRENNFQFSKTASRILPGKQDFSTFYTSKWESI